MINKLIISAIAYHLLLAEYPKLRAIALAGSNIAYLAFAYTTLAQSPPPITIPFPSNSPLPLPFISPSPEPTLQTSPTPQQPNLTSPQSLSFPLVRVEVSGNTIFQEEIAALIKPFENRETTFEELLGLRSAITQLYLDKGYVTSGAFIPSNQVLNSGIVIIQVLEGELERIELNGLNRLQPEYVRSRIALAAEKPLNTQRLQEALELLQLDPLLERVNAELIQGSTAGRNVLQVNLKEAPAFRAGISTGNRQSPSIGSQETNLELAHENFLGFGDRIGANYAITNGLNTYELNYTIPLNAQNDTLNLRYGNSDSRILEEPFQRLDIRSETQTISVGFRQPLVRSPYEEFALGLSLDLRQNQTFLLNDIPFSFSEGAEKGRSKVSVIRFTQDWLQRNSTQVLAARSQFSLGIDAFDATINNTGTDGRFFSWLGQFQWVQQLSPRALIVARIDTQLTPSSLLSLERLSLGGVDTVRGYRQNLLVADNAVVGSVEVRFPLSNQLRVVPFFDMGTVWNNRTGNPTPTTIAGVGLGVRWLMGSNLSLRLDYGIPLIGIDNRGNSLQDNGLYFLLRYQPF